MTLSLQVTRHHSLCLRVSSTHRLYCAFLCVPGSSSATCGTVLYILDSGCLVREEVRTFFLKVSINYLALKKYFGSIWEFQV
jgi:hypothetical protein